MTIVNFARTNFLTQYPTAKLKDIQRQTTIVGFVKIALMTLGTTLDGQLYKNR